MVSSSYEAGKVFEIKDNNNTNIYQTSPVKNNSGYPADEYNISQASKLAFSSCAAKINSFEDYKRMRTAAETQNPKDLWSEYQDFLKIRGCSNNLELIALNSTGLTDTDTLKSFVTKQMHEIFDELNIKEDDFSIENFVEGSSIENIAKFFNNMKTAQGSLDELNSLYDFIETGLDNSNFDTAFRRSVSDLLEQMEDMIDFLKKKII